MRYFLLIFGLAVLGVMVVAGKRGDTSRKPPIFLFPDMDRQPRLRPQKVHAFFEDQRSSRLPVSGTVARGEHYEATPQNNGRIPGTTNFVETIPVPITETMLQRGRERYAINCAPCHGPLGDGKGITSKFGMVAIANFHDARLVSMPDGEIFNTITYGKNQMGAYGGQVEIADRWAIVAYVRALQRARLGSVDDVPPPQRSQFGP
jgi:mono/diheme cytochrome c family protein